MEHLTRKQIEDYSQNRLTAAELLAASDHLADCDACRGGLEAAMNGDAALIGLHAETFAGEAVEHLTPQEMAEYVDKNLTGDSLFMVQDHVDNCQSCAFAVADLRAFRNEIAPSLDRDYQPAASPAHKEVSRKFSFAKLFRVAPIPAFGTAALLLLLFGVIGYIVWRSPESQQEIAVVPSPSPSPLPSPSAELSPAPSPVTLMAELKDGSSVVALDREGRLTGADDLPPAYQNLVKKALGSQRVERSSQLEGLTRQSSSLMGSDQGSEFSILEPVGNVLLTDRPTFRWSAMEGASAYVVEVYDQQFKLVASSPQQTQNSWTTTLPRGNLYSWQVKATKEGQEITSPRPPAPQAKFRVLDQGRASEIARAKRTHGSSRLTLGLLYAEAGLLREAEQEFRALRRANPNSDIARNLLRQIQAMRSRPN